jgi:hypothetical protein
VAQRIAGDIDIGRALGSQSGNLFAYPRVLMTVPVVSPGSSGLVQLLVGLVHFLGGSTVG